MNKRIKMRVDEIFNGVSEFLECRKDTLAADAMQRDSEEERLAMMVVMGAFTIAIGRRVGGEGIKFAHKWAKVWADQVTAAARKFNEPTGLIGINSMPAVNYRGFDE